MQKTRSGTVARIIGRFNKELGTGALLVVQGEHGQ